MKHLLLSLALIISANAWADMNNYCDVELDYETGKLSKENFDFIKDNCERNNILAIYGVPKEDLNAIRVLFCRYDRNVTTEPYGYTGKMSISCVLYDNEPRKGVRD